LKGQVKRENRYGEKIKQKENLVKFYDNVQKKKESAERLILRHPHQPPRHLPQRQ